MDTWDSGERYSFVVHMDSREVQQRGTGQGEGRQEGEVEGRAEGLRSGAGRGGERGQTGGRDQQATEEAEKGT